MMPALMAEEALTAVAAHGIGGGTVKKEFSRENLRRWNRAAAFAQEGGNTPVAGNIEKAKHLAGLIGIGWVEAPKKNG